MAQGQKINLAHFSSRNSLGCAKKRDITFKFRSFLNFEKSSKNSTRLLQWKNLEEKPAIWEALRKSSLLKLRFLLELTAVSRSWTNLPSWALPLLPLSKEILQYNLKVTKRCAKYGSSLRYVARQILECKIAWQNICRESLYFCFPLLLRLKSTISRNVGIG